jgi:hypothetical protein
MASKQQNQDDTKEEQISRKRKQSGETKVILNSLSQCVQHTEKHHKKPCVGSETTYNETSGHDDESKGTTGRDQSTSFLLKLIQFKVLFLMVIFKGTLVDDTLKTEHEYEQLMIQVLIEYERNQKNM